MKTGELFSTTICALASGNGGAIGVIRVSGKDALSICSKIFVPSNHNVKLADSEGYKIVFGTILDKDTVVDEVLMSIFRTPRSYTGEDSVEISCHASRFIEQRILELLISNGAVSAGPGEFTQRAFLNGKMDLSQAEAVADLIASESKSAHRIAMEQMRGAFSKEIEDIRSKLLHFASMIELELDFGEEDVEFADRKELISIVKDSLAVSERLTASFSQGNVIKNGIPVAIVGNPNTGKSTLLNRLLHEDKAIISDIPGTTRDAIEDTTIIDGTQFRFIDTAGIRDTDDIVEKLGIDRTIQNIEKALIIILVADICESYESFSVLLDMIREKISTSNKHIIISVNKIDRSSVDRRTYFNDHIKLQPNESIHYISAKEGEGLEELTSDISLLSDEYTRSSESVIVTNIRHYEALVNVNHSLSRVISGLELGLSEDLVAIDLRQAIHYFGTITGQITSDEVLGNIFKNFCIGK